MLKKYCAENGIFFNETCSRCDKKITEIVYLEKTEVTGVCEIRTYCRRCAELWALVLFKDLQEIILELDGFAAQAAYSNFLDHWNHRLGRNIEDFDTKGQKI